MHPYALGSRRRTPVGARHFICRRPSGRIWTINRPVIWSNNFPAVLPASGQRAPQPLLKIFDNGVPRAFLVSSARTRSSYISSFTWEWQAWALPIIQWKLAPARGPRSRGRWERKNSDSFLITVILAPVQDTLLPIFWTSCRVVDPIENITLFAVMTNACKKKTASVSIERDKVKMMLNVL